MSLASVIVTRYTGLRSDGDGVKPWRRITGWLALLSVILYGLLPSVAACAARPAPAQCVLVNDHACSCRPEPHVLGDCCCGDHGANSCAIGKLPCDGGPTQDGSLSALAHPLAPVPRFVTGKPLIRTQRLIAPASPALRVVVRDLHAPPPRLVRVIG